MKKRIFAIMFAAASTLAFAGTTVSSKEGEKVQVVDKHKRVRVVKTVRTVVKYDTKVKKVGHFKKMISLLKLARAKCGMFDRAIGAMIEDLYQIKAARR